MTLEVGSTHASVRFELASVRALAPVLEYAVGALVRFLGDALECVFHPSEVDFPHRARGSFEEYEGLLGTSVRFRRPACLLVFPRSVLRLSIPTANPLVARMIEAEIQRERRAAEAGSFRARVERVIAELAPGGADGRRVARFLGVSPRTLQRSLEREGTSFRDARARVLVEMAEELLADAELPIAQIATRLGFADAAAFGKAFRRWTGETPSGRRSRPSPT